ncbi:SDR family oxidoreductase [Thiocystis violacea]|uniref:SDR family oxidoreductase n=1 Tax=Thiocystis violacea TaxID=13725 RepID=UPI0019084686|nr:SDR family oxidoreductase [Thiocystis violacea]MBK1721184.1 short chain dehydrogenase [Thiocystis violacea]
MSWTTADIPSQDGRLAVITGGTGGLGYETALALAAAGAEVVLAGRNDSKGANAVARIRAAHPDATARFERLDLASLASVAAFAEVLLAENRGIDLLVNNAGVMALPGRQVTVDGFERQFATNYLGHFALTARLLPLLRRVAGARMVNVSSLAASLDSIDLTDLQSERGYVPFRSYGMTKLTMLMLALEFQRRSEAAGWGVDGLAAHPGYARTDIISNGPASRGLRAGLWRITKSFLLPLSPAAELAVLPILFAATSPDAQGGGFYGPTGWHELKGPPGAAAIPAKALDGPAAALLWETSERLAGARFA